MGYSVESISAVCYANTTCLINKLNIQNEKLLSEIEADITFAKATAWETAPLSEQFDFEHYKMIHKYLFEDLYDWAGQIRTINISKKGTDFTDASEIETIAYNCFNRLKSQNYYQDQEFEEFVGSIVDFYCVTNMLHPFREGNGRTQRIFLAQLIRYNGYEINFSDIDTDALMTATIHAAHGVNDYLMNIFKEAIQSSKPEIDITMI